MDPGLSVPCRGVALTPSNEGVQWTGMRSVGRSSPTGAGMEGGGGQPLAFLPPWKCSSSSSGGSLGPSTNHFALTGSVPPRGEVDVPRGLLRFAEAKPLGERGLRWLYIHLANVYGKDKLSFRDRAPDRPRGTRQVVTGKFQARQRFGPATHDGSNCQEVR